MDGDHDGLPDRWEERNGLDSTSASDAGLDVDHDGKTNREEFLAGTLPQVATSVFQILECKPVPEGMSLRFSSVPGRHYLVQQATSSMGYWFGAYLLPEYYDDIDGVLAKGNETTVVVQFGIPAGDRRFFRVRVNPVRY